MIESDAVIAAEAKFGSAEHWNDAGYIYFQHLLSEIVKATETEPTEVVLARQYPISQLREIGVGASTN